MLDIVKMFPGKMIQQNRPLFKLNMTKTITITKRKRCNKCRLANEAQKKVHSEREQNISTAHNCLHHGTKFHLKSTAQVYYKHLTCNIFPPFE